MNIYADLALLAVIVTFIVETSGFTQSWRRLLARWLHVRDLRPLPPFDCGLCATWWACLIWAACAGQLTLLTVLESAILAALSNTIHRILVFIIEALNWIINKITP